MRLLEEKARSAAPSGEVGQCFDLRRHLPACPQWFRRRFYARIANSKDGRKQSRESAIEIVQPQVVHVNVADNIDTKQTCIDHQFEVMRHARFRPPETQRTAGKILFGREHAHERQPHWITEGLKHFGQLQILYTRMDNKLHL